MTQTHIVTGKVNTMTDSLNAIQLYKTVPPPHDPSAVSTISYTSAVSTSAAASTNPTAPMRVGRTAEPGDRHGNALNTGTGSSPYVDTDSRISATVPVPSPVLTLSRGLRPSTLRTLCDRARDDVGLINRNSSMPVCDERVIEREGESETESDDRRRLPCVSSALSDVSRSRMGRSVPPTVSDSASVTTSWP